MKPKIELSVDKTKVTEGDIVEMSWSCSPAEKVQLTLDNGYKTNTIDVESSGSKKFRLNRSKGRTHLVICVTNGGKPYYKSVGVRVRKMKASKAEEVYDYTGHKGVRRNGLRMSWNNYKEKMKMAFGYLPEKKRLAVQLLLALGIIMLLTAIWPKLTSLGFLALAAYLFWIIWKK